MVVTSYPPPGAEDKTGDETAGEEVEEAGGDVDYTMILC